MNCNVIILITLKIKFIIQVKQTFVRLKSQIPFEKTTVYNAKNCNAPTYCYLNVATTSRSEISFQLTG